MSHTQKAFVCFNLLLFVCFICSQTLLAVTNSSVELEAELILKEIQKEEIRKSQEANYQTNSRNTPTKHLNPVLVISKGKKAADGSRGYLTEGDLKLHNYDDINRALGRLTGVQTQGEDGYGLIPNISIRGVDPNRSKRLMLLEDSVPISPAPYSDPAAYYSPIVTTKSGIEVLKGGSRVNYGPHTTGGVLNYLSKEIPQHSELKLKGSYGSGINKLENDIKSLVSWGKTFEADSLNIGLLIQNYYRQSEGFKTIQTSDAYDHKDKTGFFRFEPSLKLQLSSIKEPEKNFTASLGYNKLEANESYVGITDEDFKNSPYERYTASGFDNLAYDHIRSYLRYSTKIKSTDLSTTAYYNYFHRNWYKLRDEEHLSTAVATNTDLYKGAQAGTWSYEANNRYYFSTGLDLKFKTEKQGPSADHSLEYGLRYHVDQVYKHEDIEEREVNETGLVTNYIDYGPGSKKNYYDRTHAVSGYLSDEIKKNKWIIKPGIRIELAHYLQQQYTKTNEKRYSNPDGDLSTKTILAASGGFGLAYLVSKKINIFTGLHQGTSLPGPSGALNGTKPEGSLNFELGTRIAPKSGVKTELTFFNNYIANFIVFQSIASGDDQTKNANAVNSIGAEWSLSYDPGVTRKWAFRNPYFMGLTLNRAITEGKQLRNIPYLLMSLGTGIEIIKWGINMDGRYHGKSYGSNRNTEESDTDVARGAIDGRFILDMSFFYLPAKQIKVFINGYNLFNSEHAIGRAPAGLRPGRPLSISGGMEITF